MENSTESNGRPGCSPVSIWDDAREPEGFTTAASEGRLAPGALMPPPGSNRSSPANSEPGSRQSTPCPGLASTPASSQPDLEDWHRTRVSRQSSLFPSEAGSSSDEGSSEPRGVRQQQLAAVANPMKTDTTETCERKKAFLRLDKKAHETF